MRLIASTRLISESSCRSSIATVRRPLGAKEPGLQGLTSIDAVRFARHFDLLYFPDSARNIYTRKAGGIPFNNTTVTITHTEARGARVFGGGRERAISAVSYTSV
jgi:hypothetical protein